MSPFRPANDPERRRFQDPEAILSGLGLKAGDTFVDVGCGGGFFALPAARIIGESGKLYGFDRNAEAVDALRELASSEGLDNLELTVGDAEESVLCERRADIVFFGLVVVHLADPVIALENARKMLAPNGRIAVFDWKKKLTRQGPPLEQRVSEGQVVDFIKAAGFGAVTVENCGAYHYLITAKVS
jgi:ubiquinone/menaquinone biosynthesis C-methylase UbiE